MSSQLEGDSFMKKIILGSLAVLLLIGSTSYAWNLDKSSCVKQSDECPCGADDDGDCLPCEEN